MQNALLLGTVDDYNCKLKISMHIIFFYSLRSATMGDKAMPDKASLHNISSECFDGLHDTQSHLQQDSSSQVKVGADGSKRITTSQPCTADER